MEIKVCLTIGSDSNAPIVTGMLRVNKHVVRTERFIICQVFFGMRNVASVDHGWLTSPIGRQYVRRIYM